MSVETDKQTVSKWLPLIGLVGLLVLSEAFYLALLQLNAINGWQAVLTFWLEMTALFVFYGLAAVLVKKYQNIRRQAFWLIILGAILFRLTLLPAGLPFEMSASEKLEAMKADLQGTEVTYERYQLFDNDIWRYIWDGHVWSHGINPYLFAPSDARLDELAGESSEPEDTSEVETAVASDEVVSIVENNINKDLTDGREIWSDIRDNVNYADVTTIYPPLAQLVFRLSHEIAPGSLLMMKFLLVLFELIGILFLTLTLRRLELPMTSVILYAWNPLMIKVFAGSGHADAILVVTLCATAYFIVRGSKSLAATAFGLAILAKLSPLILVPFVVRRIGWLRTLLLVLVVFVGYAPFLSAGQNLFAGFLKFAQEWQFNAGAFALIRFFSTFVSDDPAHLAREICAILILMLVAIFAWRDDLSKETFVKSAVIVLGATIILSPTVMPWYLSWVLPLAVLARQNVWFYFSALVLTAFHIIIDLNEYSIALWFEHGLLFALIFRQVWLNHRTLKISSESGFNAAT